MKYFILCLFFMRVYGLTTGAPVTLFQGNGTTAPFVAVGSSGNAAVTWTNTTFNTIYAATYDSTDNVWSAAVELDRGGAPRIGIDGVGNAFVIYIGQDRKIYSARYVVGTGWLDPVNVSKGVDALVQNTSTINDIAPNLSVNDSGVALITWIATARPGGVFAVTFDPSSETYSEPVTFLDNQPASSYQINDNGFGIAVGKTADTFETFASTITIPPAN